MPTSYTDQFYLMDPFAPPAPGTLQTPVQITFVDENDDGVIGAGDTINGVTITESYPGDVIRVSDPGTGTTDDITGVTFYDSNGDTYFTPTDGTILEEADFEFTLGLAPFEAAVPVTDLQPPCFTPGTMIDTADGPRPVESLEPGDLIVTADHGLQPLLYVDRREVAAQGKFAPVLIRKGALGNARDLRVSQQHRMLISGWEVELHTGQPEMLAAAKHLVNGRDITIEQGGRVTYVHLLFARHQIIFAEGIATESYLPAHAVGRAEAEVNRETLALFPDMASRGQEMARNLTHTARPVMRPREIFLQAS